MSVVDTLEILVEADARGLETQLKRGMQTVTSFVNQMNSQEVNWQKILAGSLDAAIISGIASSFAIAIGQAVSFQSSLLNLNNSAAGTASAMDLATGSISSGLVDAAGQAGASLGDTAAAYESLYKQIGDSSGAEKLTGQIGEIALELGTNLGTLMPKIIELFNQWGITTLPAAESALTGLVESAGQGKFTFDELLGIISQQGPILQTKTNVSDLATQLQALSNVSTLSKSTIVNDFEAISASVANPLSNMNLLAGTAKSFTGPNGLLNAMQKLNTFLHNAGDTAQTFGQQFGLSSSAITQDANTSASAIEDAKIATQHMQTTLTDLDTYLQQHESVRTKFQQEWAKITSILSASIGVPILEHLITDLEAINKILSAKGFGDFILKLTDNITSGLATPGGLLGAPGLLGPSAGGIVSALGALLNKPQANNQQNSMGPVTFNTNVNVQTPGGNNPQAIGTNIATGLYDAFTGMLSKIHL